MHGLDAWTNSLLANSLRSLKLHTDLSAVGNQDDAPASQAAGSSSAGAGSASTTTTTHGALASLGALTSLHLADKQPVIAQCVPQLSALTNLQHLSLEVPKNQLRADAHSNTDDGGRTQAAGSTAACAASLDINPLSCLRQLRSLSIAHMSVGVTAPLTHHTALTSLQVEPASSASVTPIVTLTQLQSLVLYDCKELVLPSRLTPLTNLRSLSVHYSSAAVPGQQQEPLSKEALQRLASGLSGLTQLTHLGYTACCFGVRETSQPHCHDSGAEQS